VSYRLIELPVVEEPRGRLAFAQGPALPFTPRRWFAIYDVPAGEERGAHAHHELHEVLVCVHGRVTVAVDDGRRGAELVLDRPSLGLYLPPLVWRTHRDHSPGAVLMGLASHPFDAGDYIRDHDAFVHAAAGAAA
jgi:UDP-2-acetamido-3-amino-2,3-dideoxy-glucuronate N-acetyltransferase